MIEDGGRHAMSVRAYLPESEQVWLVDAEQNTLRAMRRVHLPDFMKPCAQWPVLTKQPNIVCVAASKSGEIIDMHDPYAVEPYLSDFDRFLFGEGRHWQIYNKMGAHLRTIDALLALKLCRLGTERSERTSHR